MRRYTLHKPQRIKLAQYIHCLLVEHLHALVTLTAFYDYSLPHTQGGPLSISCRIVDHPDLPSLMTAFTNQGRASQFVDCNLYSGKYNLHIKVSKGDTAKSLLPRFYQHLRPVLDDSQRKSAEAYLVSLGCDL